MINFTRYKEKNITFLSGKRNYYSENNPGINRKAWAKGLIVSDSLIHGFQKHMGSKVKPHGFSSATVEYFYNYLSAIT